MMSLSKSVFRNGKKNLLRNCWSTCGVPSLLSASHQRYDQYFNVCFAKISISLDFIPWHGKTHGMRNETSILSEMALDRSSLHPWFLHRSGTSTISPASKRCDQDGLCSRLTLHSLLAILPLRIPWGEPKFLYLFLKLTGWEAVGHCQHIY